MGVVSPGKKNFEELSRQFSQSSVAQIQFRSGNERAGTGSPISTSLKKIAGNFNVDLNLQSERILPQSLSRPGPEAPSIKQLSQDLMKGADNKASYLKNIAHLNIPKKARAAKLSPEEV